MTSVTLWVCEAATKKLHIAEFQAKGVAPFANVAKTPCGLTLFGSLRAAEGPCYDSIGGRCPLQDETVCQACDAAHKPQERSK